jgi:hypothetical protein
LEVAVSVEEEDYSKSVKLYAYLPEQVPQIWPHVKDYIESSLIDNGHICLQDVYDNLLLNNYQLWTPVSMDVQAAIVTTIQDVRGTAICTILCCGGKNMKNWMSLAFGEIENWARDEGCKLLKVYGRKGWARLLGFEIVAYEMKREL